MKISIIFLSALSITSCSSIKSIEVPVPSQIGGLNYYMPKKDLVVKVTVSEGKMTAIKFDSSPAYPDLSKPYILKHANNLVGKNSLKVVIKENGLLSSVKSTTTSDMSAIFGSIATNLGKFTTIPEGFAATNTCKTNGDHIFIYPIPTLIEGPLTPLTPLPCGLTVTMEKIILENKTLPHSKSQAKPYSGIFYRQDEPYKITVFSSTVNSSEIIYSPSGSKTFFLPASRTLFANNVADFGFTDGVPIKYDQDVDGEVLALLKIPAVVLESYFTAVGSVFENFKNNDTKEIDAISTALLLDITRKKIDICNEALKLNDKKQMTDLGCYDK